MYVFPVRRYCQRFLMQFTLYLLAQAGNSSELGHRTVGIRQLSSQQKV